MRVLVNTNVLMDYLIGRVPYYDAADTIAKVCAEGKISEFIAAHSISNLFYLLRKDYTVAEGREILTEICNIFRVVGIENKKIINAIQNNNFNDFEDCLQMECALECSAEYIVTRNVKDFVNSLVKVILPSDFNKLGL